MQFLSTLLFISGAAALGINCRGSGFCSTTGGASLKAIHEQLGNMIADGHGNRVYGPGKQLACSQGEFGSICAFFQSGVSGNVKLAHEKAGDLLKHGCKGCGSCPTKPGNNVATGQLTVNFVAKSCCKGNCYCL